MRIVRGTQSEKPEEIDFQKDTVYVRKNVHRVEEENFSGWEYEEEQMTYEEYFRRSDLENKLAIAELAGILAKNGG